jgi:hypothetical protein
MGFVRWLTRRCFVCGRLRFMHSVQEEARCENMPLPIEFVTDDEAVA